ncbi:TaqI-like C-terminal specificity domain-containing protein [Petrotoga sp. HKA.pet.4.5]|uniref:Eco57I restriction-modification methylase domain-containing protein n=1 Tax=Petrotoga sp. HKA.pet.4.5 TaxID=1473155 RepID=UPI000EF1611E|nr:TaqI-like C-terminal specificity domain-containing protein [Petrotoga sp. HKA.pet.4.5]
MSAKDILESIISKPLDSEKGIFDLEKFIRFFRAKNNKLSYPKEQLYYTGDNFANGRKLAEGKLDDGELIVCSFLVKDNLTERSGKKVQYQLGKKILKDDQKDAGIFIFYDARGDFRFSLIYTNYLGKRRDWSNFKRFTYFVSKDFTNKTFLNQVGNGDFTTLEKIKEAFSVEPVTKQFYAEIQTWYFWAMDKIKFPEDYKYSSDPVKDKEISNATNLIRLITRIIFIWFLKEKDLIPAKLFLKDELKTIVKDFMKDNSSSNFYNAILQNLFFGTLNQKMNERKFADEKGYPANKKEYGVKNLYRYADKFLISKNEVLKLFEDIPFLNGGLFDCLDKENETGKVIYIDGFSRNKAKQTIIPDYLFFQKNEEKVDLSQYGLGSNKPVRGLFEILNNYNFTIDENTPIDQEIALDPELLGKVFENLLASYNPETATTARKATGSYYTPREIVDYMVEASLLEYLKEKLPDIKEEKIKLLLSYSETIPEFSEDEKQKLISAIDEIKILDPACGSGAFPMGVLHKLVSALQKLDPENKDWRELQYQKAIRESEEVFRQGDKSQREERLKEINETFDEGINYPDYARKLYLIENCIYGIDIQPIAIQISKLRFFISLVLDQKVDSNKENLGIRALPNLETRFVAANTLLGLDKPLHLFYTDKIKELEDEIKFLRHKYFQAKTRWEKLDYQNKDKELRELLAKELKQIGFSSELSEKIAKFDLYNQNAFADFFEPEWMFGVKDGFDIVIGNPPWVQSKFLDEQSKKTFRRKFTTAVGQYDLFNLFIERAYQICKELGVVCFITPDRFITNIDYEKIRKFLLDKTSLKQVIALGDGVFENVGMPSAILIFQKVIKKDNNVLVSPLFYRELHPVPQYRFSNNERNIFPVYKELEDIPIITKINRLSIKFGTIVNNARGVEIGKKSKALSTKKRPGYVPFLRGEDIYKYYIKGQVYIDPLRPDINYKDESLYRGKRILIRKTGVGINAVLDEEFRFAIQVIYIFKVKQGAGYDEKYLLALLNSRLMEYWYFSNFGEKERKTFPHLTQGKILSFPIFPAKEKEQKTFINLVDKILALTKDDDYLENTTKQAKVCEYEKEIDQMIYKLYGLTAEEIKVVENHGAK